MSDDRVANYMTQDVVSFHPEDAVPDAVRQLVERGVDGAPVIDDAGQVVGMLSASDVMIQDATLHLPTVVTLFGMSAELPGDAAKYDRDIHKALASTVGELMGDRPVVIDSGATMREAATLLHDHDVSRLPVVDEADRLVGIIARGDVLRYLIGNGSTTRGEPG